MTFADDLAQVRQLIHEQQERLPMFTVYDHPSDMPDFFVARLWLSLPEPVATGTAIYERELERLHHILAMLGGHKLDRSPQDDPVILETWIL